MAKKLQRRVVKTAAVAATSSAPATKERSGSRLFQSRRVSTAALSEFTSQLAVLLDAGIPVTKCLRILEGQMSPGVLRDAIGEVLEDVEGGTSFSESLGKHPAIFNSLYTNMVRAGEAGGVQEEILNRLADFMETSESIKARVKGALAYPVAVLCVSTIVVFLVFVFVIPQFRDIFEQQFGTIEAMPWATRVVIATGEHLKSFWWAYVLGVGVLIGTHVALAARVRAYRRFLDSTLIKIPLFGTLAHKSLVARFSRTFATLIESGVPHLEALDIVRGSVGNVRMQEAVDRVHSSIREGAGIAVPMGESRMFDDIVINMVDVGEQTGELDRMLSKVATRYETEVDRTIESTFRVIEPVLLVVLAVFVGFIVFALFSPLLKLMQSIGSA
jgi:type IV pilus assembly protein PilC